MRAINVPAITRRWSFTQSPCPPLSIPLPMIYRSSPSSRTVPPRSLTRLATATRRSDSFKRRRAPLTKELSPEIEQARAAITGNISGICSRSAWIGLEARPVTVTFIPSHTTSQPASIITCMMRRSACTEFLFIPVIVIGLPVIPAATIQIAALDQSPSIW